MTALTVIMNRLWKIRKQERNNRTCPFVRITVDMTIHISGERSCLAHRMDIPFFGNLDIQVQGYNLLQGREESAT